MDGYDVLVLVDTVAQQDDPPGSLYVIEPDLAAITAGGGRPPLDPHDLPPGGVLALLPSLGGMVDRALAAGRTPQRLEDGIGLSETVEAALDTAASTVLDVVRRESSRITA